MDHFDPIPLITKPDVLHSSSTHASSSDAHLSQAQAASMRRKKNADAQAAFRARRANYIASLEETVTSLEAVVLSLQDTCREARSDANDLRHENARLLTMVEGMKLAARDREKQWRDFWNAKQQALGLDESHMNDFPPRLAPSPPSAELHSAGPRQYVDDPLRFQPTPAAAGDPYPVPPGKETDQRFPASLQPFTTNPEGNWIPGPFSNTRTPCVGEAHPSHSSEASDSPPSISPAVQYSTRFPLNGDDNRMSLVNLSLSGGPYESGTLSVPEYASEGYQNRHTDERFPSRPRRAYSGPNPRGGEMYAPDMTSIGRVSSPLQLGPGEGEGANGDTHGALHGDGTHLRPRRHTLTHGGGGGGGVPHSRSSSPSPREREREPPMSNTLAVIKAQAFGSLRRTRTRVKKPTETGSKVAIDILCTRGIGMGVQSAPAPSHQREHGRRKGELDDVEMNP